MKFSEEELNGLYRYALALSQHKDDAYDLLQSSLEKYLIELKCATRPIEHPLAFLRTLIRNRHIDQLRHQQRWKSEAFEECATYDISPESLEQSCIDAGSLRDIWRELSPLDRDILYHWAALGFSIDEVSIQLEIPRGTLLSRVHRLRKNIDSRYNNYFSGEKAR
jgi:RNA polymerase sigma-70 factor (ECF subfamily)